MKGISPLISIVLIIAFTIAIAGVIFPGFLTPFTREASTDARDVGRATIDCGSAAIEAIGVSIDTSDDELIVNIKNKGLTDFKDISLAVKNETGDALTIIDLNQNLTSGGVKSLVVEDWDKTEVHEVTVNTECPGIFSTLENDSGTFKEVF